MAQFDDATALAEQLLSSALTRLQEPIQTPSFGGVNMGPMRNELSRLNASREQVGNVLTTEQQRYESAVGREKEGLDAQAAGAVAKINADQDRAQQIADLAVAWMNLAGVSPTGDTGKRLARLPGLKDKANAELADIQEMQNVAFFDNPLEWAYNQIQLPNKVASYNRTANLVNSENDFVQAQIARTKDATEMNEKAIPTITARQAQSDAAKELAIAMTKKAVADKTLATVNVSFANERFAKDLSLAQMTDRSTALELQQAQTMFQAQLTAVQMAESRINRDLKAAELVERLSDQKQTRVMLANFDRIVGNVEGTTTMAMFNKLPTEMRNNIVAVSAGSYGVDLVQFAETIRQVRPPNLNPETQKLFNWTLEEGANVLKNNQKIAMITDKRERDRAIATELHKTVDAQLKNPSRSTIFKELSPAQMLSIKDGNGVPLVNPENPIGKALAQIQNPGAADYKIIASTIAAVYPNDNEAGTALAEYYAKNAFWRNYVLNLPAAGVKNAPVSYNVPFSFGFGTSTFDLTKPAEATKFIIANRRKELVMEVFTDSAKRRGQEVFDTVTGKPIRDLF